MRSKTPDTELPVILANPSTGILNSALVKKNGGTDAANAAKADKAENWLNSPASTGAGSGPYTLSAYSTTSQITLTPSANYWGAKKPKWSSAVIRNMIAPTQLLNVARGSHEIALDLSADQAGTLKGNKNVNVSLQPSTWIFFLMANNDPTVSSVMSNSDYQTAIRYALDYSSLVALAGTGAIQAPGLIPSMFLGALPQSAAVKQDLAKAKAALAASGDASQQVTLQYPSDLTINGVPVHLDGPEGPVEPPGSRLQRHALGVADLELAQRVPVGEDGVRPLALGPGLPGPGRLPGLHPGEPGRPAGRLAEGV